MKVLFLNAFFSEKIKELAISMSADCEVFVISSSQIAENGIKSYDYKISKKNFSNSTPNYLKTYEEAIIHGEKVFENLKILKNKGIIPDLIIANSCGCSMYVKEIFNATPLICLFDNFNIANNNNSENERLQITYNNAHFMPDFEQCDLGIVSSQDIKNKIPDCFWEKIIVCENLSVENLKAEFKKLKERISEGNI